MFYTSVLEHLKKINCQEILSFPKIHDCILVKNVRYFLKISVILSPSFGKFSYQPRVCCVTNRNSMGEKEVK